MIWDQAAINDLKTLHAQGISYAEIGRRLSCTKNAAVGMGHRLELERRPSPIRPPVSAPHIAKPASKNTLKLLPSLVPVPPALFGTVAVVRAHHCAKTTLEQDRRILLMTELSDRKCAEVIGVSRYAVNRVRRPQREAAREALPALASLSPPLPKPTAVVFQKVAAIPSEERDRRILAMGNLSQNKCAKALGISHHVVRYVREKHGGTAPVAATAAAPCQAVMAPPSIAPQPPPEAITATYSAPSSCQWPTGERTSVYHTFRACGCAEVVPGKPYCAEHSALAYVRVRERAAWPTP